MAESARTDSQAHHGGQRDSGARSGTWSQAGEVSQAGGQMGGKMGGQVDVGGPCSPLFLWFRPCPQPTPPSAYTCSPTKPSLWLLTPHGLWKGQRRKQRKSMSRMESHHTTTGPKTASVGLSHQIPYRRGFKDPPTSPSPWCPDHHAWAQRQTVSNRHGLRSIFLFSKREKKKQQKKKCPPITGGADSPDRSEAPNPITRDFRAQPCTGSCD